MNPAPDAPVYNLKAVVRETGLKPDTIRAWERRYGLPDPRRTDSGHRLYSQNDMQMLKWLVARQAEGMNISQAIDLWRRFEAMDVNPADPTSNLALSNGNPLVDLASAPAADNLTQLRNAWVNACLNFDEQAAERAVAQAFALFSVEVVCIELLQRGLAAVGEGWFHGQTTVQQEHFASALATRRLETLLSQTPPPTRPSRILIGCPPDETHTFAPLLLALFMRRRGWDVIFLGADIPLQDFIATTRSTRPQLVVLVAQQLYTAATLLGIAQSLASEHTPMAFGGRIFAQLPELRQSIPGVYLGNQVDLAPQMIENILAQPTISPPQLTRSPVIDEALRHFKLQRGAIEAEVWRQMSASGIPYERIQRATTHWTRNIIAALTLGNMAFLQPDFAWLEDYFRAHLEFTGELMADYTKALRAAIERSTGNHCAIITAWLDEAIRSESAAAKRKNDGGKSASKGL